MSTMTLERQAADWADRIDDLLALIGRAYYRAVDRGDAERITVLTERYARVWDYVDARNAEEAAQPHCRHADCVTDCGV